MRDWGTVAPCAPQHLLKRALKNQFAAGFAATGTDVEEMIGRADDRLLVFDHQQRVALVAQVMHHPNEPANIARMETDARLVHDEERVNERGAEAGGEIDPLDFAAAQRAGGAIESEITNPDLAEVTQPGHDFATEHKRGGVVRRKSQADEKFTRLRDRARRPTRAG